MSFFKQLHEENGHTFFIQHIMSGIQNFESTRIALNIVFENLNNLSEIDKARHGEKKYQ
jgi:hypothetical protein